MHESADGWSDGGNVIAMLHPGLTSFKNLRAQTVHL